MNKVISILLALVMLSGITTSARNFIPATNNNIRYIGRYLCSPPYITGGDRGGSIKFSFPGFQIRTVFEGTSLKMLMKPNSGYYMVELDDREPYKLHCSETDSIMTIADSLQPGKHNVIITMVNEGYSKKPEFYGFILDEGCTLPEAPVLPERKIEFLGNSITCGYGVEGKSAKERFSFATENQYFSYDAITARNLNAQCFVVARSGIGVYRNWGGPRAGNRVVYPDVYPYTILYDFRDEWDFTLFTPDVVCMNFGTNDTSLNKWDSLRFVNGYIKTIRQVRSHYPKAKIVILSGTMISPGCRREVALRNMLDAVRNKLTKEGDTEVFRFDMSPEDGSMGAGSDGHPSRQRQEFAASELTNYLRQLMEWK